MDKMDKMDQNGSKWIMEDQIGFIAYGAALMIEIIFQSCLFWISSGDFSEYLFGFFFRLYYFREKYAKKFESHKHWQDLNYAGQHLT